jgi:hypothetical protein
VYLRHAGSTATLERILREHVRLEERELFEEIERIVPAVEFERLRP